MPFVGEPEKHVITGKGAFTQDELRALAAELGAELNDFAFKAERILARLDMRAARKAREMARELRLLEIELVERSSASSSAPLGWGDGELAARFGRILRESLSVLTSCDAPGSEPSPGAEALRAHAASFDDPEEITDAGLTDEARRELLSRVDD